MVDRKRAEKAIAEFLIALGRSPKEHADHKDTAKLVTSAFIDEFCAGYAIDAAALAKRERITVKSPPAMIRIDDIEVRSLCPHHLMPTFGRATIVVKPKKHILGLGAYAQVVQAFAARLTLQEDLGENIVETLADVLTPTLVGCRLALQHTCFSHRGEREGRAIVTTHHIRKGSLEEFVNLL
jgi:GTP cyclohydrolase IA